MGYLHVKNWEKFQHYKDRNPPWIKLSRDLLRDYDFTCLQDASKLHLMLIWLLASQMDNKIPADAEFVKNQIGVKDNIDFNELISKGFLIDASNTLAQCKQDAMLETETETDKKTISKDIVKKDGENVINENNKSRNKKPSREITLQDFTGCKTEEQFYNWMPDEWFNYASTKGATAEQLENESAKFWLHHSGKGTKHKEWESAWQYWIWNAKSYGSFERRSKTTVQPSFADLNILNAQRNEKSY